MKNKTRAKIVKILFIISLIISLLLISDTYAKYHEQVDINYGSVIKRWNIILNENELRSTDKSMTEFVQLTLDSSDYMDDNVIVPTRGGHFDIELDFSKVDVPFKVDFLIEQNPTVANSYNNLPDFKVLGFDVEETGLHYYYGLPSEYQQVEKINSTGEIIVNTEGLNESDLKLIPCYRKSDNVIGMYDIVTGRFFTDLGEGTLSKGADLNELIVDPEEYKDLQDDKKVLNINLYIKWVDGDGTLESPIDELDNDGDTSYTNEVLNEAVKYKITATFEQYIQE